MPTKGRLNREMIEYWFLTPLTRKEFAKLLGYKDGTTISYYCKYHNIIIPRHKKDYGRGGGRSRLIDGKVGVWEYYDKHNKKKITEIASHDFSILEEIRWILFKDGLYLKSGVHFDKRVKHSEPTKTWRLRTVKRSKEYIKNLLKEYINEEVLCPYCNSRKVWRDGKRYNLNNLKQRMHCKDCDRKFTMGGRKYEKGLYNRKT